MGKLVLLLADGTTQDILLRRERITVGRRPDNDVCLPYPAVSGEHAAVTTILSDSFLEDLGSTNGTLVNGDRIQKHVLRDGDLVEVGRQRLVFLADDRAEPSKAQREALFPADSPRAPQEEGSAAGPATVGADAGRAAATPLREQGMAREAAAGHGLGIIVHDAPPRAPSGAARSAEGEAPELIVLTGPRAGRCLTLVKEVTTVGRAGMQLALVRRTPEGYRLCPVDGNPPPELNGEPVSDSGALLGPGDVIAVAGARIEFCVPPDLPT